MAGLSPPVFSDVTGVIHCHSTFSDGMESIETILGAAHRAGLDYLLMTDHNTLAPLAAVGEQWSGPTLLLLGCEVTPRHNHYLAYGISEYVSQHLPPVEYTAAVAAQGGIGFLAHPHERGSRFLGQNRYTWEDWAVEAYTGIEVWNYFSQWVGACQGLLPTLRTLLNWRSGIRSPDAETLGLWDRTGRVRRVVGIGGVDAHGIKTRLLGLELVIHPYEKSFRTVRTHLLLPRPFARELEQDRALVMNALREGCCYFANHAGGDPRGFTFLARSGGEWLTMGQERRLDQTGSVWFSASVPYTHRGKPRLRLLRDGAVIAETVDCDLQAADQGPGVYRLEAYRRGRGWIFSNPIYLREP